MKRIFVPVTKSQPLLEKAKIEELINGTDVFSITFMTEEQYNKLMEMNDE